MSRISPRLTFSAFMVALLAAQPAARADGASFNRDIRPLLAAKCFACHGPDEDQRQAGLRLDVREAALDSGVLSPGEPDDSELLRRIESEDAAERMPPPDDQQPLSPQQIEQVRQWIAAGAKYERHWAFVPPQRPALPPIPETAEGWPRNAIDRFVLARLHREGLGPSPEADRHTLVRRLHLDLIGLPPTVRQAEAFVRSEDPLAYEKLADRLLASPHYGERWGRLWLDLARYADTNGYEKDRPRSIWPYRDWVIDALNADLPFDEFSVQQLAGDMLPEADLQTRIATGFHRNTMLNEEGGIDPLEYRFYAMVDRVATTGTVWLGLTTGCAQCHSHKYDPISHTDYYRLMALLNNADEPDLLVPAEATVARRRQLQAEIAELESQLPAKFPPDDGPGDQRRRRHLEQRFQQWLQQQQSRAVRWTVLRPHRMETNLPRLELRDDGSIFSSGDITKRDVFRLDFAPHQVDGPITALRLEALPDDRLPARGPGRAYYEGRQGDFFLSEVTANSGERQLPFASASHSYGKISIGSGDADAENVFDGEGSTGWSTAQREGQPHQLVLNFAEPVDPAAELQLELLFERHFAASLGRFRVSATTAQDAAASDMPVELEALLTRGQEQWSEEDRQRLRTQFLRTAPELAEARKRIDQLRQRLPELPSTMVMQERPRDNPRPTHRHHRGEFLSTREPVTPGVPAVFRSPQQGGSGPQDRLEFARWLLSPGNPLVGRVTANRSWRALFGRGLVRTSGDFGTQSEPPTHPQLLDWLACELAERQWSMKQLHRLIVTSATYRQQSHVTPELLARDPSNRLLARGARFRLDAEIVRDAALAASGLLCRRIGGPSVYPPQPASVTELAYGAAKWDTSQGGDRYRRSLYTFSKRTAPFAASAVFDAPTGENCVPRRDRSNTPLQALTLLNDEMFLQLARAVARETSAAGENGPAEPRRARRMRALFQRLLTRPPTSQELDWLLQFRRRQLERLQSGELDAAAIGGEQGSTAEFASWTMAARAVMNLDEAVTRQ